MWGTLGLMCTPGPLACQGFPQTPVQHRELRVGHLARPLGLGPQDPGHPKAGEIWGGEGHEVGTQAFGHGWAQPCSLAVMARLWAQAPRAVSRLSSSNQPVPGSSWIPALLAGAGRSWWWLRCTGECWALLLPSTCPGSSQSAGVRLWDRSPHPASPTSLRCFHEPH